MSCQVKIWIDPLIRDNYSPEVCWVWRLIFSSIGVSWKEVFSENEVCDIVYYTGTIRNKGFKISVKGALDLWSQAYSLKLEDIFYSDDLPTFVYPHRSVNRPGYFRQDGEIVFQNDIIFDLFYLITGQAEKYWIKDKHGFFDLSDTVLYKHIEQRVALGSDIVKKVEKAIRELGFSPEPRWPKRKIAAIGLSHDVDYPEIKRAIEPVRIMFRQGLKGVSPAVDVVTGKRTNWHFDSWVELEKRHRVRSAFYFCAVQGSLLRYVLGTPDPFYNISSAKFRQLFAFLRDEGFEIGLHASYLAYRSREQFNGERERLQVASGQPVKGNRHHYWHLSPEDVDATLLIHEQIGLEYDSSLGHERYPGWRRGLSYPFFPFHRVERRELKTLQITPAWMDAQLFGKIRLAQSYRFAVLQSLVDRIAVHGGCFVVDVHDYVFDDRLYPDWKNTYQWFLETFTGRSDIWISTPGEIADHWQKRYLSLVRESQGLQEGMWGPSIV